MKLLYAGQGVSAQSYTALQFNCTRNAKCQREYYVPVQLFSDIVLFADLAGKPDTIEIEVYNVCDIENIGSAVSSKYVIGKTDSDSWYATLGNLIVTPPVGVTYNRFFFKVTFTIAGTEHVYYSQQYEFPLCDPLTFVRGCYPNEEVGSSATDCNGIYYGFPTNEDFLGDNNYRYIHSAYVRFGTVIEQTNKLSFTAFNKKKTYKAILNREWLFEYEILPTFYKDVILAIANRGNMQVAGVEYLLSESQDIKIIDNDSKLWKMDLLFTGECKQYFGCKPSDCVLPNNCAGRPTDVDYDEVEGNFVFTFTGGTFTAGNTIEYELREQETNTLIQSGTINTEPLQFTVNGVEHPTFDPEEECYVVKWRKCCSVGVCTDYTTQEIGNCVISPCEEAGIQIVGGTEPIYAALYWSANEVDYSDPAQACGGGGATYPVPGLGWKVYIGFYQDAGLTTPIEVTLTAFSVTVNAIPYVLNGTGKAFFIADFQREAYSLSPIDCSLEGPFFAPLPTLAANDCFTGAAMAGEGLGAGKLKMARAGGDPLPGPRMNAAIQISMGTAGPNTLEEMETTEEITLNAFYGLVMYQFETPGSHAGTITITDGVETEVIPGPFPSIGIAQPWSLSTKKFIIDPNHDITVTYDAA